MSGGEQSRFYLWRQKHTALWQFAVYAMMGCIASAIELGSFTLLNFLVFAPLREHSFSWWFINYAVEDGGLTAFLSYAVSYALGQTTSFFTQRKYTFKANNNMKKSAVMYIALIIVLFTFQLYMPTIVREPLTNAMGETIGDILSKLVIMFCTMLVQFPVNKWVIMKRN